MSFTFFGNKINIRNHVKRLVILFAYKVSRFILFGNLLPVTFYL